MQNEQLWKSSITFNLGPTWEKELEKELKEPYIQKLSQFIAKERESGITIYPPQDKMFEAFRKTSYPDVKVVIVGQDPYHGPGQAHGLSFSVPPGVPPPPSLMNIFREVGTDIGPFKTTHGCLLSWAEQGVFLLNAILTVRDRQAASHQGRGWERFTDSVLKALNERADPIVFLLWGRYAQEKGKFLDEKRHLVIKSAHPSPLSAYNGFLGSRPFSKANQFLQASGKMPINWQKIN